MKRWIATAACAAMLFAAATPATAFLFVSGTGSDANSGDLVAVWVKNGFELIVNLGPVEALGQGAVKSFEVPAEFDGSLVDAKFVALAVPNPRAEFPGFDSLPQYNVAFTSEADPETVTYTQVGDAQAVLDAAVTAQTWFTLLGSIPAGGQPGVVFNTDDEALIQTSLFASYTEVVGKTSDAIANTLTISTATFVEDGTGYAIPLYEVFQMITPIGGGDYALETQVSAIGTLSGDDGNSGNAILSVPEPGVAAIGGVALAALAWTARRQRAR